MKTIRHLLLAAGILSSCSFAKAATHVVLPGQSLQAAINGAASGDTIVIPTAASFPENITITGKALRIRGAQAGNHDIEGNFVISAGRAGGGIGIDLNGTTTNAAIYNNRIHDYRLNTSNDITEHCIGIRVTSGANADVANNVIYDCYDSNHGGHETDCGMGVFVKAGAKAVVRANVIWYCFVSGVTETRGDRLVYAPADSIVRYNLIRRTHSTYTRN